MFLQQALLTEFATPEIFSYADLASVIENPYDGQLVAIVGTVERGLARYNASQSAWQTLFRTIASFAGDNPSFYTPRAIGEIFIAGQLVYISTGENGSWIQVA